MATRDRLGRTYPDPAPEPCLCGGVLRFSTWTIADVAEAVKVRPTTEKIMAGWVPLTVYRYDCTDAPTPGSDQVRPGGCGRGAVMILDRTGWPVTFLTDLAKDLFISKDMFHGR